MMKNIALLVTDKVYMDMAATLESALLSSKVTERVSITFTDSTTPNVGDLTDAELCIILDFHYSLDEDIKPNRVTVDDQLRALVRIGEESGNMNIKAISLEDIAVMFKNYGGNGRVVEYLPKVFELFPNMVDTRNLLDSIDVYRISSMTMVPYRTGGLARSKNLKRFMNDTYRNESKLVGLYNPFTSCPTHEIENGDMDTLKDSSMVMIPECTMLSTLMDNPNIKDTQYVRIDTLPALQYRHVAPISELMKYVDGDAATATPLSLYKAMFRWLDSKERVVYMEKLNRIIGYIKASKLEGKRAFVDITNLSCKDSVMLYVYRSSKREYHTINLVQ